MQYESFDGVRLNFQELGDGTPLLLLHGLFSNADTNWVRYGTARRLVEGGYRLILPDLRGHGASDCPVDAQFWPADVLAQDVEALISRLGLGQDFHLGGYSLGGRTVVRLLARGLQPRSAIIAGMGLSGIVDVSARSDWFIRMIQGRGTWQRGSGEFVAERFMKANIRSPEAIINLLRSQRDTPPAVLKMLHSPISVLCGADDQDNGSAESLADMLPNARYRVVPGTHMSAVTRPELAAAMLEGLERDARV